MPLNPKRRQILQTKNPVPVSWWKQETLKEWLPASSVLKLRIMQQDGKPVRLGYGFRGNVFFARAAFRNSAGKTVVQRIALKKFQKPLSDSDALEYSRLIEELKSLRYPIPKTTMLKVSPELSEQTRGFLKPGEWVQLQQYFGRGLESKILDRFAQIKEYLEKKKANKRMLSKDELGMLYSKQPGARADAIKLFTQLANLGFEPKFDLISPLMGKRRVSIPFDFDLLVEDRIGQAPKPSDSMLSQFLLERIKSLAKTHQEREKLYRICLRTAKPGIRKWLRQVSRHELFNDFDFTIPEIFPT